MASFKLPALLQSAIALTHMELKHPAAYSTFQAARRGSSQTDEPLGPYEGPEPVTMSLPNISPGGPGPDSSAVQRWLGFAVSLHFCIVL